MADDISNIDGLAEVMANLDALAPDLREKVLKKAGKAAANVFMLDARSRAPVEDARSAAAHGGKYPHVSGALRNSIHVVAKKKLRPGIALGFAAIAGNDQAYYASWIEWGFHHVDTHEFVQIPYMRPAFESQKEVVLAQLTEAISSGIDRMQNGRITG